MMILPAALTEKPEDIAASIQNRETPLGEYLGAKVSAGFDSTSLRAAIDSARATSAEVDAYGDMGRFEGVPQDQTPFLSEEDWKSSDNHREGIAYDPRMTPVRAKILADDFDQRRYRDSLIARSPGGFRSVLGFGAQLLGNLPDPVNFIPLIGEAGAGASIARRAGIGALEAAAGTALQDTLVIPDLKARGEDVGFADAALDVMFGAALGGMIGGGAGWLDKTRTRRARERLDVADRQAIAAGMEKALDDMAGGRPVDVAEVMGPHEARLQENMRLYASDLEMARADKKELGALRHEESRAWRSEADAYVASVQEHAIIDEVTGSGGFSKAKIEAEYGPEMVAELNRKRPGLVREGGTVDPILFAMERGIDDDQAMMLSLIEVKTKRELRDNFLRDKQAEFDTRAANDLSRMETRRQGGWGEDSAPPAPQESPSPDQHKVNWAKEDVPPPSPPGPVPLKDPSEAEALRMHGMDASGHFPEMDIVKEMEAQGRVLPDEVTAMRIMDEVKARASKYEDGFLQAVDCIIRTVG